MRTPVKITPQVIRERKADVKHLYNQGLNATEIRDLTNYQDAVIKEALDEISTLAERRERVNNMEKRRKMCSVPWGSKSPTAIKKAVTNRASAGASLALQAFAKVGK